MSLYTLISIEILFNLHELKFASSNDEWFNLIHTWNRFIGSNEDKYIILFFSRCVLGELSTDEKITLGTEQVKAPEGSHWNAKQVIEKNKKKTFLVSAWINGLKIKSPSFFSVVFVLNINAISPSSGQIEQSKEKLSFWFSRKYRPSGIVIPKR